MAPPWPAGRRRQDLPRLRRTGPERRAARRARGGSEATATRAQAPEVHLAAADPDDPELSARLQTYWRDLGALPPAAWHQRYMERLRQEEGRSRRTFWVEAGSERVGLVVLRVDRDWVDPERRVGYIVEFTVFAPRRRRGYGRAAFHRVRELLRREGCPYLELDVLPHNRAGMEFWRSLGFEVVYHHLRRGAEA